MFKSITLTSLYKFCIILYFHLERLLPAAKIQRTRLFDYQFDARRLCLIKLFGDYWITIFSRGLMALSGINL